MIAKDHTTDNHDHIIHMIHSNITLKLTAVAPSELLTVEALSQASSSSASELGGSQYLSCLSEVSEE